MINGFTSNNTTTDDDYYLLVCWQRMINVLNSTRTTMDDGELHLQRLLKVCI